MRCYYKKEKANLFWELLAEVVHRRELSLCNRGQRGGSTLGHDALRKRELTGRRATGKREILQELGLPD